MADQPQATPFTAEPAPVVTAEQTVAPVADPQPEVTPAFVLPETVKGLVGEGMKYATPEAALESLPHAQHHIDNLEQEMSNMREDLAKRKSVEEVLQEINKTTTGSEVEPQLTQDQLDALIDSRLQARTAQDIRDANTNEVKKTFVNNFGDNEKANEAYNQKAKELGISIEELNTLSATSPKAVFSMFGLKQVSQIPATKIDTNINSEAVIPNVAPVQAPTSVMGQSTYSKDIAAWNAAAPTE